MTNNNNGMRMYKQEVLHNPEQDCWGDCHRACLASMLGCSPAIIHNFAELAKGDPVVFWEEERKFLCGYGLLPAFNMYECTMEELLEAHGRNCPKIIAIAGIKSIRDTQHSILICGDRIMWDPHPDAPVEVFSLDFIKFIAKEEQLIQLEYLIPIALTEYAV